MKKCKVTSDELREMKMGRTETYQLGSASEVNSGAALAYRLQYELGCKFQTKTDRENNRLTISKIPKR